MANDLLNFYSFVRRGMAAGITDAGAKLSLEVTATEKEKASDGTTTKGTVDVGLTLVAPEDIIGFDPRCIVKKRPDANTLDAEFDPYAMVEFDQPDLPWRYTPKAVAGETLMPWIALIVLEENEPSAVDEPKDGKLGVLTVSQKLLPDLSKVPYWAHTQVTGTMKLEGKDDGLTDDLMAKAPHKLVSRLICGRQLRENKTYNAYLVPTFERGRLAGLGKDIGGAEGNAWDSNSTGPIDLPVYYQWSFKTGNVGSFRQLALRLRPGILPSTIGWRAIDVSNPGLVPIPAAKDADGNPIPMQVEGALQSPSARDRGNVPSPDETQWVGALKTFIEDQEKVVQDPDDPSKTIKRKVVAPPLYGRWHANQQVIPDKVTNKPDGWFRTLNIDPTLRVASALGTSVIQKEQEPLMASAWRQAGELPAINQALKVLQVGVEAYDRAYQRHLKPLATPNNRTAFLQRLTSLLGKIPYAINQNDSTTVKTVAGVVQETRLRVGVMSGAWRRLARPRSKLGRLGRTVEWKAVDWVNAGNWIGRPWDGLAGGLSLEDLIQNAMVGKTDPERAQDFQDKGTNWLEFWGLACFWVGRKLLESKQGHYWWLVNRLIKCGTMLLRMAADPGWTGDDPWEEPSPLNDPAKPPSIDPPQSYPPPFSPSPPIVQAPPPEVFLSPKSTLPWQFWRNVRINGEKPTTNSVDPIMAAPDFPQPMYQPLRDISKDWILPGISEFAGNTVAIALTNQKFIEAYMVGLNQEMARELVWRDYPTDRRGSCFRQFWDTRGRVVSKVFPNDGITEKLDISRIHEWSKDGLLGEHRPPGAGDAKNQVVLMVRGDLIARYPNVVVYARLKDGSLKEPLYTVFQGMLPPDVGFYGVNLPVATSETLPDELNKWQFVIQERPGEFRFAKPDPMTGLPLELVPPTPPPPQPPPAEPPPPPEPQFLYATTDGSGRLFAAETFRRPTRVVIDGTDLITST